MSKHDPAYPQPYIPGAINGGYRHSGITIRQEFVKAAMLGLLSNDYCSEMCVADIADEAVEMADAVIKRMEETEKANG